MHKLAKVLPFAALTLALLAGAKLNPTNLVGTAYSIAAFASACWALRLALRNNEPAK